MVGPRLSKSTEFVLYKGIVLWGVQSILEATSSYDAYSLGLDVMPIMAAISFFENCHEAVD